MTPEQAARYARQRMLPEIGDDGQRRIFESSAAVDGSAPSNGRAPEGTALLAHRVARRYAERAGFLRIVPGAIQPAPVLVRHDGPRAVLAGALAALAAMRASVRAPR